MNSKPHIQLSSEDYNIKELNEALDDIYLTLNAILKKENESPPIKMVKVGTDFLLTHTNEEGTFAVSAQKAYGGTKETPTFKLPSIGRDGQYYGLKASRLQLTKKASKKGEIGYSNEGFSFKQASGQTLKFNGTKLNNVKDVIDGNPSYQIGSSDTECFSIETTYESGAKGLSSVSLTTKTASTTDNRGEIYIKVDEFDSAHLNDDSLTLTSKGTVSSSTSTLVLKNYAIHPSSMANTQTSIEFQQRVNNTLSPDYRDSGKISVGVANSTWSTSVSTQDAYMIFSTTENGTLRDHMILYPSSYMFIKNSSATPGTPSGGGYLYVDSGALKYKGSSGTVTTLGAA
jgi:hypothetical protein